jgi:hypothetical protein
MNPAAERIQLVTRLLPEHELTICRPDCPIGPFQGNLDDLGGDPLEALAASPLKDAQNIARHEILTPLLGGAELAGWLTTTGHQVFLIDGELMFSEKPSDVRKTSWWNRPDGSASPAGQRLTHEVCAAVGAFQDEELELFLAKPGNWISLHWQIRPILYKSRNFGRDFARLSD